MEEGGGWQQKHGGGKVRDWGRALLPGGVMSPISSRVTCVVGSCRVVSVVLLGVLRHLAAVTSPGRSLRCVIRRITLPDFRGRVGVM